MASVAEPFPISHITGRYLLFDVDAISHARRAHNICGVLIGTIPNLSQQNVFLGVPLELMPEEARVLVEQGHAYLVDEVEAHRTGFMEMSREDRLAYLQSMDKQGIEQAERTKKKSEDRAARALKSKGLVPILHQSAQSEAGESTAISEIPDAGTAIADVENDTSLFNDPKTLVAVQEKSVVPHYITPTTSYPPLLIPQPSIALPLPPAVVSYPLFRYLHGKGYFSMPGLRFGCHYSVYPGDPLRFHSHFLATGLGWDDEFDLLDIVGGGRLGTGVKKAYLLGGEDANKIKEGTDVKAESVRAFSIEWAGL
jgi:tRNA-splicing endonuclease subunit Sen34